MRVLVIAPHPDDETLGMGGTIARFSREGHDVVVAIMTGHGRDSPHPLWPREHWDGIREEAAQAHTLLGVRETIYCEVPAVAVADQPVWQLNAISAGVVRDVQPEMLFVPFPLDLHKDHREIFHSVSVTWRPMSELGRRIREVYSYEVLSETHLSFPYVEQAFNPNLWIDVSSTLEAKLEAARAFKSQLQEAPNLRSLPTIEALARLRGSQMGVVAAEAFVMVRRFM
jgi:LmbE family N-acetylglucosaminyl deacetylase